MEIDQGDIGQRLCFDASVFFAPAADDADDATSSSATEVSAFDVDAFLARHATAAPTLHALHADLRAFDQRLDARYGLANSHFGATFQELFFLICKFLSR